MSPGTVVVSIDAELAWGYQGVAPFPTRRVAAARPAWRRLLAQFDAVDVPATWAIVGHLFLDRCDGRHASHPAPEGWFDRDPGGTVDDASAWLGRDLVEAVAAADADHEIASHSFSHVQFGEPDVTRSLVERELWESVRLAADLGIDLDSFVFPSNSVGHRDLLAAHGFECYRDRTPTRGFERVPVGQVRRLYNFTLGRAAPPLATPRVDEHGLVALPGSFSLFHFDRALPWVATALPRDPMVREVKLGVERAAEEEGVFHLWFHPNDLVSADHLDRFERVLRHLDDARDRGEIRIETMRSVAQRCRS